MCQLFLRACSPCCGVVVASKEKALEEVSFYRVVVGVVQNVADGGCFESIKKKLSVVWPFFGPKKDDDQNFFVFSSFCVCFGILWTNESRKRTSKTSLSNSLLLFFHRRLALKIAKTKTRSNNLSPLFYARRRRRRASFTPGSGC